MKEERLSVQLDAELLKKFKTTIITKRGKLYGAMKEAVEEALKDWIKKHGG